MSLLESIRFQWPSSKYVRCGPRSEIGRPITFIRFSVMSYLHANHHKVRVLPVSSVSILPDLAGLARVHKLWHV